MLAPMFFPKRIARYLLVAVTLLATINAGYYLAQVLVLEIQGAIRSDGLIYMIVGRGILNGLIPYVDLYETKPPGMFLLSALSLVVSGDETLACLLQVGIFLGIPLLLAGFAWWETRKNGSVLARYSLTTLALLLGTLLALHLQERSGGFQTESFGAFFAAVYVLHVFSRRNAPTKTALLLNTSLLLGAFGMKEPFILTTLAAMLLIARDPKHFLTAFLLPLALAIGLGTVLLAALGWLRPYVSIYLPSILAYRLSADPLEPLWLRGLAVGRIFGHLSRFSTAPLFGWMFGFAWFMAPALKTQARAASTLLLTLATSVVAFVFLIQTQVFLTVVRAVRILPVSFDNAAGFVAVRLAAYALLLVFLVVLLRYEHRRGLLMATLLGCATLYLTSVAVGEAGYMSWHWGFAFPVLFALALLFLRYAAHASPWSMPVVVVTVLTLATALFYQPNTALLLSLNRDLATHASRVTLPLARRFDQLLDQCQIRSYFTTTPYPELAFAQHSPLGPIFFLPAPLRFPPEHPLIRQTYANVRDKAQIIVLREGSQLADFFPDLDHMFSPQAPPCAAGFLPLDQLVLYFRKT